MQELEAVKKLDALFESAEELTPEGLALAVAHLQAEQLAPDVTVDAHGHEDRAGADLQGLAEPPVEVRRIQIENG